MIDKLRIGLYPGTETILLMIFHLITEDNQRSISKGPLKDNSLMVPKQFN